MTRLDIELIKRKFFETRSQAQNEIKNGIVYVNGKKITKNSHEIKEDDIIEIKGETLKYVSRGGLKLEKALKEFNINLTNKIMLDIGSSTGGFTDCALQNNVKEVIDIDVGKNQLSYKIKNNPKVKVFEKCDIRNFENDVLNKIDIITIDISFISVTKILEKIKSINNAKEIVCLIKPQFECGKEVADKYKGIILNKEIHKNIIEKIIDSFNEINYYINGLTFSPVKGGNGNIEYLAYFAKTKVNNLININNLVDETFSKLK